MNLFNYTYLKITLIFGFALYLALAASFDEFWFWNWSSAGATFYFIILFSFLAPIGFVLFGKWLIPQEINSSKLFDFERYNALKPLDALSDHYTNVATIGVLFTLFIYSGTKLLAGFDNGFVGVFISLLYVLIIFLYSLYALRLFVYARAVNLKKIWQFAILVPVLTFDVYMIQTFIEIAPKFKGSVAP